MKKNDEEFIESKCDYLKMLCEDEDDIYVVLHILETIFENKNDMKSSCTLPTHFLKFLHTYYYKEFLTSDEVKRIAKIFKANLSFHDSCFNNEFNEILEAIIKDTSPARDLPAGDDAAEDYVRNMGGVPLEFSFQSTYKPKYLKKCKLCHNILIKYYNEHCN